MCGFAGIVSLTDPVAPERLRRMQAALRHRGPDDEGAFNEGRVGLAHTRLSILDLSIAGSQPMLSDSGLVLAYNGEIFNHPSLRRELGGAWKGSSDTETLLRALEAWGMRALTRLNGQFAFALVDRRANRLFLARDHFGVKPLYFVRQDDELIFGSEIKSLIAGGYRPVVDDAALRHAIELSWVGGAWTPLKGVKRVLPGTVLEFDLSTLSLTEHEYYHPADVVRRDRMKELANASSTDNTKKVEQALRLAVERQLLSDVPVGTMLSGGVDSSLLTALASEANPKLHAFNVSVDKGTGVDEGPYAEMVAEHLGINLHQVKLDQEAWIGGVVDAVIHYEYPLTHEASVPLSLISGLARRNGVKVLLAGEGADELFGGYRYLHKLDWALWFARKNPLKRLGRELYAYLARRGWVLVHKPEPRTGPVTAVNDWEARNLRRCTDAYASHDRPRRQLEGKLLDEIHVYLAQILCRGDKNIMQNSIEGRVPFLDPDLVELAVNYPLEHKIEPRLKNPLRVLADKLVPEEISNRKKIGFRFTPDQYFSPADPRFLRNGYLRQIFGVSTEAWDRYIDQSRAKYRLWTAEIWCRHFLERASPQGIRNDLWR